MTRRLRAGIGRARLPGWPHASLRVYLVAVILFATVPIATLMTYQLFHQVDTQQRTLQNDLSQSASALAQRIHRELISTIDTLSILAQSGELQRGDIGRFHRMLIRRPLLRASWSGLYLKTSSGEILFDTAGHRRSSDAVPRMRAPFVTGKLPSGAEFVSRLEAEPQGGGFVTSIEVPVTTDGGTRFILGVRIAAAVWQKLAKETGISPPLTPTVFDRSQRTISPLAEAAHGPAIDAGEASRSFMRGRPHGSARLSGTNSGATAYAAWDTVPLADWIVAISVPARPIDAAHARTIATGVATAVGCLALGVILALTVARRVTQPLRRLANNELALPSERIAVHEIALLRDALMAAKVHDEITRELIRKKRDLLGKKAAEFQTLLASSPIGLAFAQDRQCRTVIHNAAMDAIFGPANEAHLRLTTVFYRGHPLPREAQPLQRAAALGESSSGLELEIRVEGRSPAFVLANAVPLCDDDGRPRGAIGAVVDITERKAFEARLICAEQRLRESQHLVDLAQETGHVGFLHYRVGDRRLAWTPGQAKLFGIEAEAGSGSFARWTRLIDRSDWRRIVRTLRRAFAAGLEMETLDYRVSLHDGSTRWLSTRLRLVYDNEMTPQHLIGVTVDMTEQKNAERERDALIICEQAARIEAEAANRSKDEFLAMLGHELRNPLSAIASGVEVLKRVRGDSETAQNALHIIGRQTRHLAHMMDDLLDVARVMTGRVSLTRNAIDLGALVERVIATLQISGEFNEHRLTTDIRSVWVSANATRMEQVASNLLVNAIKYTPPGGQIAVCVRPVDDTAAFEVHDTGVGIPPDRLDRVFDLFVQGERSLDRRAGGLGVGLTLVRRLVELHEGSVVATNADPGTIMTVRLPLIEAPTRQTPADTEALYRKRRVAIVEDNPDVIDSLSTVLRLEGHTVLTATDGTGGLQVILRQRPDVAIVDIGLPGLTGYEVATRSRAGGYDGKLIALSGYGQDCDRSRAFAAGFDFHFMKPVESSQLLSAVTGT